MKNRSNFFKDIQKRVNQLGKDQKKELAQLKQYTVIYNSLTKVEDSLYTMGREDEVFEDSFNYFMEELQEGSKQYKKYTLVEAATLIAFAIAQVIFVRHLFNRKGQTVSCI